jgi:hypothetical protein
MKQDFHYCIREYKRTLCGIDTSKGGWLFIKPNAEMPANCKACGERSLGLGKYWKCFQSGWTDEEIAAKAKGANA